jgi:hypothetical protein
MSPFGTAQRGTGMGPGGLSFQTFISVNLPDGEKVVN